MIRTVFHPSAGSLAVGGEGRAPTLLWEAGFSPPGLTAPLPQRAERRPGAVQWQPARCWCRGGPQGIFQASEFYIVFLKNIIFIALFPIPFSPPVPSAPSSHHHGVCVCDFFYFCSVPPPLTAPTLSHLFVSFYSQPFIVVLLPPCYYDDQLLLLIK